MLVRHKSGAASAMVVEGRAYEPVGPGIFDVEPSIAEHLLRYPDWEIVTEILEPEKTEAAATTEGVEQKRGGRRRGGGTVLGVDAP